MSEGFVPTRAALAASSKAPDFQLVTYKSHKSLKQSIESKANSNQDDVLLTKNAIDDRKGIDIKRARREIIKFGMTAFTPQEKQDAKIALAVSLGAKPPKKEYKNYKLLLDQKKKQKIVDDSQIKLQQAGKNSAGKSIAKDKFGNKSKFAGKNKFAGKGKFNGNSKSVGKNKFVGKNKTVVNKNKSKGDLLMAYGKAGIFYSAPRQ